MKLAAQVKLQTTPNQFAVLKKTLETANAACNYISRAAWGHKMFNQFRLHHLVYREVREKFGLSAEVTVRCISKVADAYKKDRNAQRKFKPRSAIAFDDRILSWRMTDSTVSIWTMGGRLRIPFGCGDRQRTQLTFRKGESDLILFRDNFYLSATCEIDEAIPAESGDVIGIDLGVVNIAVTSDGQVFAGNEINRVRHRHRHLRTKLQSKGTRSVKRKLKKLSGKERRFARDVNHRLSKQIVKLAQGTQRSIALEDLSGIRTRVTARREQRAILHSWSFFQLRSFLEYKCRLAGVPLTLVDPRNTSRTCPRCAYVDKANRPNQSTFKCQSCGYSGLADWVAATNIRERGRAVVNLPNVARDEAKAVSNGIAAERSYKSPALAGGS